MNSPANDNPFFQKWDTPYQTPPFDRITLDHIKEAFPVALARQKEEIAAIIANPERPSFENVIVALEKSGALLESVERVFSCLVKNATNTKIKKYDAGISQTLSKHGDEIFQNQDLFTKVRALFEDREALPTPQRRLVERYYNDFRSSGAHLPAEERDKIKKINARISELATQFVQNECDDRAAFALPLVTEDDRRGLSGAYLASAAEAAAERHADAPYVATLGGSAFDTFLKESARPDLRKAVLEGLVAIGKHDNANNAPIIEEMTQLRARAAKILDFENHAAQKLSNKMAGTPEAVHAMHEELWGPTRRALLKMQAVLEDVARADQGIASDDPNWKFQPWDWDYYVNMVMKRDFAVDEDVVRRHLPLESCLQAAFQEASRFGLTFTERTDIPTWHPDVRTWNVTDRDGNHRAVFYGDFYSRKGKENNPQAEKLRTQNRLVDGDAGTPLVFIAGDFSKPPNGKPTLLTIADYVGTLWHEFGHALHIILADVDYPSLADFGVKDDFVELPSQFMETRALTDGVLAQFARHHQTGDIMPQELRDKIRGAAMFNKAYETAITLVSAAVDMEWHSLRPGEKRTVDEIENAVIKKLDVPYVIRPYCHRSTRFTHIAEEYDAGYYGYPWSARMVADVDAAYNEKGGLPRSEMDSRLHRVLAAGDSEDPLVLLRMLLGRDPDSGAFLRKLEFLDEPAGTLTAPGRPPTKTDALLTPKQ